METAVTYRLASSLNQLRNELNLCAPSRSKSSDGWIGDAAHASRESDHNPWVKDAGTGIVTACDFTHDPAHGADMNDFVAHLVRRRDLRIKYIIWNQRIWRSYKSKSDAPSWASQAYSGKNRHTKHAHVSVSAKKELYDSTASWGITRMWKDSDTGSVVAPLRSRSEPSSAIRPVAPSEFQAYRDRIPLGTRTVHVGLAGNDVRWIQAKLGVRADGLFGPITDDAVREWQRAHGFVADGIVGRLTWRSLLGPAWSAVGSAMASSSVTTEAKPLSVGSAVARHSMSLGEHQGTSKASLTSFKGAGREGTIQAIKEECIRQGVKLPAQIAYVLATVQHETGDTFKPVREANYLREKAEAYRKKLRYYPYYGRGYVQLTWRDNYKKYGDMLGLDLVHQPDLVLKPEVSLFVLVHGMKTGAYTSKKLADYITASQVEFAKARAIVNGKDRAELIAGYARAWLKSIKLR
ncbi:peptidoglycan-binding protein [Corallococcus sp. bb12-1]|uniref:peptidoglycan-binding protein n=1 Tax=Corallococcus sp. bb12-1 TaxID=2996784 RepID=UPI00226F242B|nr:peptidoglycan-binding protein [Corallococcus sp. bb12-1]MCY1042019.1 peptidoglycan-binding protein [Corallococcus sp. bb12-1]